MKNDRYVIPNEERGGWDVIKDGHRRATAYGTTQAQAVSAARRVLRREGGGELRVKNRAGKIVRSDTIQGGQSRQRSQRA